MRYGTVFCIDGSGVKNPEAAKAKRPIYRLNVKKKNITRSLPQNGESGFDFFARQIEDKFVAKPILITADCPIGLPAQPCDVYLSLKAKTFLTWLEQTNERLSSDNEKWRAGLIAEGVANRSASKPFVSDIRAGEKPQVKALRRCDEKSNGESLYCLVGGKQVGRAALQFWFEVLQPLRERFRNRMAVWPFESLENKDVVVAECYPALYIKSVYGYPVTKSKPTEVVKALSLLRHDHSKAIQCEIEMETWMHAVSSDDEFDTFTTAYYVFNEIMVGCEDILSYPKNIPECKTLEGWILGLSLRM